jgi:hypothetical protein
MHRKRLEVLGVGLNRSESSASRAVHAFYSRRRLLVNAAIAASRVRLIPVRRRVLLVMAEGED